MNEDWSANTSERPLKRTGEEVTLTWKRLTSLLTSVRSVLELNELKPNQFINVLKHVKQWTTKWKRFRWLCKDWYWLYRNVLTLESTIGWVFLQYIQLKAKQLFVVVRQVSTGMSADSGLRVMVCLLLPIHCLPLQYLSDKLCLWSQLCLLCLPLRLLTYAYAT